MESVLLYYGYTTSIIAIIEECNSVNIKKTHETTRTIKSEIGAITKCGCCDSYNIYFGNLTLHMNGNQVHSLFYMLLNTMRLENSN